MTSDAELIAWSLAGDDDAFVEVVRRHAQVVGSYLVRRAGRGAAEDLLGEVWVAALRARGSYDRSFAEARPWLLGIARNVLRAHWRRHPDEDLVADMVTLATFADPWAVVDERIDGAAVLHKAVAGIPHEEREVLLLVAWEGLSVADAARAIGVPPGTARRYLHQARLVLRSSPGMVALLHNLNSIKEPR